MSGAQQTERSEAAIAANGRVDRNVGRHPHRAHPRLFDDDDAGVELRVQAILSSRRRTNASGQDGEDISNIRAALRSAPPNAR